MKKILYAATVRSHLLASKAMLMLMHSAAGMIGMATGCGLKDSGNYTQHFRTCPCLILRLLLWQTVYEYRMSKESLSKSRLQRTEVSAAGEQYGFSIQPTVRGAGSIIPHCTAIRIDIGTGQIRVMQFIDE